MKFEGFSPENLKAQYIPDEDFTDNGTAFVLFSLVGSKWHFLVRLDNQLDKFKKYLE